MLTVRDPGESGEGGDDDLADNDVPSSGEFFSLMRARLLAVESLAALASAASVLRARHRGRRTDPWITRA
jgi:hypothetical protein